MQPRPRSPRCSDRSTLARESAVTAWLLHAVAATRDHRDSAALTALTTAIDLAQPEGIRRPFLQPGGAPPELLTRYRDLGGRHDAFAADLLAQLHPQPVTEPGLPIVEHLTERELSVLGYLPTMLKAGEIARRPLRVGQHRESPPTVDLPETRRR